ncbi:MAG: NUDIX hydrolase [Bacteroidetes bacterium]|nr:MAG: NUDIX hydrolase [Bacteroidota bacterium]
MYKIYFGDNILFLTNIYKKNYENNFGLFCKYSSGMNFNLLIELFEKNKTLKKLFVFDHNLEEMFVKFKTEFQFIEAAGGLVFNKKGEILFIKRRGKWDLPKGKVEPTEECHNAALRETSEECGITNMEITSILCSTYHTYFIGEQRILKKTFWYKMEYSGNEELKPQQEEDITFAKWFKKSELKTITDNTYPSIIDVLKDANLIS